MVLAFACSSRNSDSSPGASSSCPSPVAPAVSDSWPGPYIPGSLQWWAVTVSLVTLDFSRFKRILWGWIFYLKPCGIKSQLFIPSYPPQSGMKPRTGHSKCFHIFLGKKNLWSTSYVLQFWLQFVEGSVMAVHQSPLGEPYTSQSHSPMKFHQTLWGWDTGCQQCLNSPGDSTAHPRFLQIVNLPGETLSHEPPRWFLLLWFCPFQSTLHCNQRDLSKM